MPVDAFLKDGLPYLLAVEAAVAPLASPPPLCTVLLPGARPGSGDAMMLTSLTTTMEIGGVAVECVSLLLACREHRTVYHMDSQRGAVVQLGGGARCSLAGHSRADVKAALEPYFSGWDVRDIKVPLQRRLRDSPRFASTTALYLLAALPASIPENAADVSREYRHTNVDLNDDYPGYMTREWYPPHVAETVSADLDPGSFTLPSSRLGRQHEKKLLRRAGKKRPRDHETETATAAQAAQVETAQVETAQVQAAQAAFACAECGVTKHDIKRCSACHQAYYCSAKCQNAHWPLHRVTCRPPPATTGHHQPAAAAFQRSINGVRAYSKWEVGPKGGFSKALSASDLLKLRLKGGVLDAVIDAADESAVIVLVMDTDRTGQQQQHGQINAAWVVGLWRPKPGSFEASQKLVSIQAGWPQMVADLKLTASDIVQFMPDGRKPHRVGGMEATRPHFNLTVQRGTVHSPVQRGTVHSPVYPYSSTYHTADSFTNLMLQQVVPPTQWVQQPWSLWAPPHPLPQQQPPGQPWLFVPTNP